MNFGLRRLRQRAQRQVAIAGTKVLTPPDYDVADTLIVAGSPRSGTTWLGEILASAPHRAVLFEPLHLDHVPGVREAGFSWRTYVRPGTPWAEGENLLDEVLRGKVLNRWTGRELRRPMRVTSWVVKCIRMNRMLPWMTERFATKTPVLVLRHPCAAISSQRAAGWTQPRERVSEELLSDFPDVKAVVEAAETDEELRAASWALDTLVPLRRSTPTAWLTVLYEQLVRDVDEVVALFERLNLPVPARLRDLMRIPSSTTTPSTIRSDPLSSWTTRLARGEVRNILRVTHALGLDFYGDDPDPDRQRLKRFGI